MQHDDKTDDTWKQLFNFILCCDVLDLPSRSIYMEFEKDVEVKGIPAYRFTPPRSVLASKEENPANEGFCVTPQECLGTGLLKVSPCRKGKCQLVQPIFSPTLWTFSCLSQNQFCAHDSWCHFSILSSPLCILKTARAYIRTWTVLVNTYIYLRSYLRSLLFVISTVFPRKL